MHPELFAASRTAMLGHASELIGRAPGNKKRWDSSGDRENTHRFGMDGSELPQSLKVVCVGYSIIKKQPSTKITTLSGISQSEWSLDPR